MKKQFFSIMLGVVFYSPLISMQEDNTSTLAANDECIFQHLIENRGNEHIVECNFCVQHHVYNRLRQNQIVILPENGCGRIDCCGALDQDVLRELRDHFFIDHLVYCRFASCGSCNGILRQFFPEIRIRYAQRMDQMRNVASSSTRSEQDERVVQTRIQEITNRLTRAQERLDSLEPINWSQVVITCLGVSMAGIISYFLYNKAKSKTSVQKTSDVKKQLNHNANSMR